MTTATADTEGAGRPALERALGHRFAQPALLDAALTHRSRQTGEAGFERLEFLGDRVLGLVVAEMLFDAFPREPEGALTRRLTGLVRKETLAEIARGIPLAPYIRLAQVEEAGLRDNANLLADCCEAVIAALYLDGGLNAARGFIAAHWRARMDAAPAPPKDAKTALQEWAQARGWPLPRYRLAAAEGPPHQPVFTVEVTVEGCPPATASGGSKRAAELAAAGALLTALQGAP